MAWPEGGINARLDLQLKQRLVMTPQLQQAIRLLQLSRLELQQEICQQMLENPLIEEGISDLPEEAEVSRDEREETASESDADALEGAADLKWDRYDDEETWDRIESRVTWEAPEERPSYEATLSRPASLADHLLWQLGIAGLSDHDRAIGEVLIGNMNDHGYLEAAVDEIARETGSTTPEGVERVLAVIQEFDPPGVGARSLAECLLIQVHLLGLADSLVTALIENHLAALEKRQYAMIAKACRVSVDEVAQAAKIIERLEPKPGRPFSSPGNFNIVPDVFVVKMDGRENEEGFPHFQPDVLEEGREGRKNEGDGERYTVLLNDEGLPKAKISGYYQSLLKSDGADLEKTRAYLEEKWRSAVWFIRSLEQRNRTILKVAESIVTFQRDFMKNGVRSLKPLVLKQVAEDIAMHESTVSRVTANKYLHTPQGIYPFKFFFNSALSAVEGESDAALSSVAVRERIERMVAEEAPSHPLTDAKIAALLKRENVDVARRTISKYRAELHIAAASRRRRPG